MAWNIVIAKRKMRGDPMDGKPSRRGERPLIMKIVAGVIAAVPVIHGVTGYYSSDITWMAAMLAVAGLIFFVADRMG